MSEDRVLFYFGVGLVVAGMVLLVVYVLTPLTAESETRSENFERVVVVSPPESWASLRLDNLVTPPLFSFLEENVHLTGQAREVDNKPFDFLILAGDEYQLWLAGKSFDSIVHGENKSLHSFAVSTDYKLDMWFVFIGDNIGVRLEGSISWTEVMSVSSFLRSLSKLVYLISGIICVGSGFILVWLFKKK